MRLAVFVSMAALLLPRPAAAQDTPRLGIVMGYPAQVGVLWTISERFAIRPEVNWTRNTTETVSTSTFFNGTAVTTTSVTTTSEANAIGTGATALFYVTRRDALRTYLAPRYSYARTATSTELSAPVANVVPPPGEAATSSHTVSGSVGAQYSVATHFGIFAELGLQYSHSTISPASSILRTDAKQTTVGLRSGAGVILFFGS